MLLRKAGKRQKSNCSKINDTLGIISQTYGNNKEATPVRSGLQQGVPCALDGEG